MIDQHIKLAVDAIVFGYRESTLHILLIQRKYGEHKGQWALPGGFVLDEESLRTAVARELKEEAGIEVDYLEQLYTFGDEVERDSRQRVVSVAYVGLVNPTGLEPKANTDALDAQWFPISDIPKLAFDHDEMIAMAKNRLASKLSYQPIGFDLLNKEFPFSDLEQLYMTILDQKIDRRNFRKKLMSFGILEELDKSSQKGSGRPAKLFRFNQQKYKELETKGFHFEIKFA